MSVKELESERFEVISPVFRDNSEIPPQYSSSGQNVNPPLLFFNVPDKTVGMVLVMHDPDAPGGDFLHWLMWDIPPSTEYIAVNSVPVGAIQGLNGAGEANYTGPSPPPGTGTHHYIFDTYALDSTLNLPSESNMHDVIKAMKGHLLDKAELVGLYKSAA